MLELTSQILGANPDCHPLELSTRGAPAAGGPEVCRGLGPKKMALALALPSFLGPGVEEEWGSQGHGQRAVEGWVQKVKE